jgi:DeoR family transcriptional regulator, fructose operon transcriptional repressor
LARHLTAPDLRVITNGMNVAEILREKQYNVLVTGGMLKARTQALVGEVALELLSRFHVDLCFLGINALSREEGLTTPDLQEAYVKRAMIRAARKVVLLIDSSKIGQATLTHVAGIHEIDLVVTDEGISPEDRSWLEENGVTVMVAEE